MHGADLKDEKWLGPTDGISEQRSAISLLQHKDVEELQQLYQQQKQQQQMKIQRRNRQKRKRKYLLPHVCLTESMPF